MNTSEADEQAQGLCIHFDPTPTHPLYSQKNLPLASEGQEWMVVGC